MVFWSRSRFFFLKNESQSEIIYRISVIIVNSDKEEISAYGEHPLFLSYRLSIIAFNINHCKETFWITFAPLLSGLWLQRDSELTILHFLSESGRSFSVRNTTWLASMYLSGAIQDSLAPGHDAIEFFNQNLFENSS